MESLCARCAQFDARGFLLRRFRIQDLFRKKTYVDGEALSGNVGLTAFVLGDVEADVRIGCRFCTLIWQSLEPLDPMEAVIKRRLDRDFWVYLDPQVSEYGNKYLKDFCSQLEGLPDTQDLLQENHIARRDVRARGIDAIIVSVGEPAREGNFRPKYLDSYTP